MNRYKIVLTKVRTQFSNFDEKMVDENDEQGKERYASHFILNPKGDDGELITGEESGIFLITTSDDGEKTKQQLKATDEHMYKLHELLMKDRFNLKVVKKEAHHFFVPGESCVGQETGKPWGGFDGETPAFKAKQTSDPVTAQGQRGWQLRDKSKRIVPQPSGIKSGDIVDVMLTVKAGEYTDKDSGKKNMYTAAYFDVVRLVEHGEGFGGVEVDDDAIDDLFSDVTVSDTTGDEMEDATTTDAEEETGGFN